MRLARIVGAFVALILAVTMGSALVSPADAAAKPKHDVTAKGGESSPNHFYIKGKVTTFHGKVKLLRSVAGGGFKVLKKVMLSSSNAGYGKISFAVNQM